MAALEYIKTNQSFIIYIDDGKIRKDRISIYKCVYVKKLKAYKRYWKIYGTEYIKINDYILPYELFEFVNDNYTKGIVTDTNIY